MSENIKKQTRSLMRRADDPERVRDSISALCNAIMRAQGSERVRLMEIVSTGIERTAMQRYMTSPQDRDDSIGESAEQRALQSFHEEIARRLFQARDLRTPLQLSRVASRRVPASHELEGFIRARACARTLIALMKITEESLNSSIEFGLMLLEGWATSQPESADLTQDITQTFRSGTDDAGLFMYFILESAHADPLEGGWMKQWLLNVIGAAHTNAAASEVLRSYANALTFLVNAPALETLEQNMGDPDPWTPPAGTEEDVATFREYCLRYPQLERAAQMTHKPRLILPPTHTMQFRRWSRRLRESEAPHVERGDAGIRWFEENAEAIARKFDAMCTDIAERPRRGLRPFGMDHVDIKVSALRNVGVRSIVFHPEERAFPDVGVDILTRQHTPTLFTFKTEMRNFELPLHDEVVRFKLHFESRPTLLRMMEYIVIDILHRIIVADRGLREKRQWSKTGDETTAPQAKTIPVRPFIRRLPVGHKASPEALENMTALFRFNWTLPPGVTFVSPFLRGNVITYDLPTSPTAVYGDEDLFDLGGTS